MQMFRRFHPKAIFLPSTRAVSGITCLMRTCSPERRSFVVLTGEEATY